MKIRPFAALLAACVMAGAVSAQEQSAERSIAAGKATEICMPLRAGAKLHWRFSADTALNFNLHQHIGAQVLMPVDRRGVRTDDGHHAIDHDNDWCLMWTASKGRAAKLRVTWRVE